MNRKTLTSGTGTPEDLLLLEYFNNKKWREIIEAALKKTDQNNLNLSIISPWGFEILENFQFLFSYLRRFYCYIGVPEDANSSLSKEAIADLFEENLLEEIKTTSPAFFKQIALTIKQSSITKLKPEMHECQHSDRLIDIQARPVSKDILTDYSNYIITCLDAIDREVGEPQNFKTNSINRWRFYQLYLMLSNIFQAYHTLSDKQKKMYTRVSYHIRNSIHAFFEPELAMISPSAEETDLINQLILPHIRGIIAHLATLNDDPITISSKAYHSPLTQLTVKMPRIVYTEAMSRLCTTYQQYYF